MSWYSYNVLELARECLGFGESDFLRTHVNMHSFSILFFLLQILLEHKLLNFPEQTLPMCFRVKRGALGVACEIIIIIFINWG